MPPPKFTRTNRLPMSPGAQERMEHVRHFHTIIDMQARHHLWMIDAEKRTRFRMAVAMCLLCNVWAGVLIMLYLYLSMRIP